MTTTESPSQASSPVLVGQGLTDEQKSLHELVREYGNVPTIDSNQRGLRLQKHVLADIFAMFSKAQDGLVMPPQVDRASASPAEPALRDGSTVIGTRNFDHLAGRGMHELRHDELREYLVSVGCNYGPSSDEFVAAADWVVGELTRKTNDERVLAVKLLRLHEAANAEQSSIAGSAGSGNTSPEPLQNLATSGHDATGAAIDAVKSKVMSLLELRGFFVDVPHKQVRIFGMELANAIESAMPAPQTANVAEAVNRFLGWKLPEDFSPDAGISFKAPQHPFGWPTGTNLFHTGQAKAMFEYCLQGAAATAPSEADKLDAAEETPKISRLRLEMEAAKAKADSRPYGTRGWEAAERAYTDSITAYAAAVKERTAPIAAEPAQPAAGN